MTTQPFMTATKPELERIAELMIQRLVAKGFYVEDMGTIYGPEFNGQYRWLNHNNENFQDCDTSNSVHEAWLDCFLCNSIESQPC